MSDLPDMKVKLQETLSRELKARGQSIHSLADESGIPSSTLHSWCNGQLPSGKNLHYLQVLCVHFDISLSELLFNTKEKGNGAAVLFSTTFVDKEAKYKLVIEKLSTEGDGDK